MSILKSIFFGLVMGLTRILPVSAGAHQQVLFRLFGVTQGALLSLLCHVGILAALYWDNRVLLARLSRERKLAAIPPRRRKRPLDTQILLDGRLARTAAIFSGVGVLAAIFLGTFDSLPILAGMLFLNGILVLLPQFLPTANKDSRSMTRLDGILMGLGGALGAVPGFSQTGGVLTAAVARGADRTKALNWSLLSAMGALVCLCVGDLYGAATQGVGTVSVTVLLGYLLSGGAAFLGAMAAMRMLRFLAVKQGFTGFAYYSFGASIFTLILYLIT